MKKALRSAVVASLRAGLGLTGETGRRITAEALALNREPLIELIETVPTPRGALKLYCLGELALWRARTMLTKEPETIEWIDSFQESDVLWDIGANVGLYSTYAALGRIRTLAFEPSASNYLLLNRNIEINRLSDMVQAFCIAFAGATEIGALNMQSTEFGGAMSSFGNAVDHDGHAFVPSFRQGMVGFTVDEFVARFAPAFPTHIKIDVDGLEGRIVAGAARTLADPRVKSVSIELEDDRPDSRDAVIEAMRQAGLAVHWKRHAAIFDGGPYAHIFNYCFRRP